MICSDAKKMLKLRSQFARDTEISDQVKQALFDAIDMIRHKHEADNNDQCGCWKKALQAAEQNRRAA